MKKQPAKKTKPAGKREQMIVLVDAADNYYEFPRSILQRSKLSEKRKKQVQEALECVLQESGYINAPAIPGSIVNKPVASSQALRYAGFYLGSRRSKS